ncbi:xanthine dehydrogenase accessory factor [Sulfolobus acidocaldarius SUSAZ]|nr:xanthine dehydrogenase accessory factor [Sulfolobus acidocaldarius SUSAZ]
MSSCEIFPLMAKLGAEGKRFALVSIFKQDKVERTIFVDGKPLLGNLPSEISELVNESLEKYVKVDVNTNYGRVVIEPIEPRPGVIIVGSGMIAKSLAKLGSAMGYYVAVVGNGDLPEKEFESFTSFISNQIETLEQIVDSNSMVIVANEGGKPYDAYATYIALKKGAKYVGVLSSAKRGALIIAEVIKRGLKVEDFKDRLYAPVGIDIGSKTAEEIALSILAEIMLVLRGGSLKHLREVKNPYKFVEDALQGKIEDKCFFIPKALSEQG